MPPKRIYTDAQWRWCIKRHEEGHSVTDISRFLGVRRETVTENFARLGRTVLRGPLVKLDERKAEFNKLMEEQK